MEFRFLKKRTFASLFILNAKCMESEETKPIYKLVDWSSDDIEGAESAKLTILKEFVKLKCFKDHCVLRAHQKIYEYVLAYAKRFTGKKSKSKDERIAILYAILIQFADPKTLMVSSLTESDMSKMIGVSIRTVRRYLTDYDNGLYMILPAKNQESYAKSKEKKNDTAISNEQKEENHDGTLPNEKTENVTDTLLPNDYRLLIGNVFSDLKNFPKISSRDLWKEIRIEYIGLKKKKYFNNINIKYSVISTYNHTLIGGRNYLQYIDKQINKCNIFEHFRNPIYNSGFDEACTSYPINWCNHPDEKAYFVKGRWYNGSIHWTKRGSHRDSYLEYKGVPKEIDIHNAMFYFMVPLLPDSISKRDRWAYCELVKKGVLYDDALEDIYEKLLEERTDEENDLSSFEEEGMLPFENEDPTAKLPDRNTVKEDFQRYRNLKGKNKNRVEGVAVYMNEKFPTIHEWMLGLLDVMQNRLAWIETDFMSFVCEKLSAENIKFEWLHDAVYVSEENYPKAQEIWDSVRDEFEAVFMAM